MQLYDLKSTIIKFREDKGWSQAELARRATVSGATISDIEAGKKFPSFETLMKIAYAFGKDLSDLLNYSKRENIDIDNNKEERSAIVEWAMDPKNKPYLEFVYNLAKEVPAEALGKLKILRELEIKPGGQNDGGK